MITIGCCTNKTGSDLELLKTRLNQYLGKHKGEIIISSSNGICSSYNDIIDQSLKTRDLKLLILMHDDVFVLDDQWIEKILLHFNIVPTSGIAGAVGASGITSLKWWEGKITAGEIHETRGFIHLGSTRQEVEAVDGCLMALKSSTVSSIKFDQSNFPNFHGYDIDFCFQAGAKGMKTHVIPIDIFHATKGGYGDEKAFEDANINFQKKWLSR